MSPFFFALTILGVFVFVFVSYKTELFCCVGIWFVLGDMFFDWQQRCYAWFVLRSRCREKRWLKIFLKKKAKFIFSSLKEPIFITHFNIKLIYNNSLCAIQPTATPPERKVEILSGESCQSARSRRFSLRATPLPRRGVGEPLHHKLI